MLSPSKMMLYPTSEDFLGLLTLAGMTPNEFGKKWGVDGSTVAKMAYGQHRVYPWALRAALFELGTKNMAMPEDVSDARAAGQRAMREHLARRASEAAGRERSKHQNSLRMEKARQARTAGSTPEQRAARRAGYKIG